MSKQVKEKENCDCEKSEAPVEEQNCCGHCACGDENQECSCEKERENNEHTCCGGHSENGNQECTCKKETERDNKLNDAYNKISELEDKLIRQNADMVNYRKRKEEEVNKMLKFCNEDIVKDILPILDNFERAMAQEKDLTEAETKFLDGFKMIYSHLQNVMEKYEVKMIDGNNKPFDPVYHNAILAEKREGVAPGMVLEVLQKGYLLKDKVIRTAMVRVSE